MKSGRNDVVVSGDRFGGVMRNDRREDVARDNRITGVRMESGSR